MVTKLAWRRVGRVFVCVSEGDSEIDEQTFEPYFDDLSQMGFTQFLSVVTGSPSLNARQRQRILQLPGASGVSLAVVFDGSPIVRGASVLFSWFLPKVKILPGNSLEAALDFLEARGETRTKLTSTVADLQRRIARSSRP
jgi:hypothetical protein